MSGLVDISEQKFLKIKEDSPDLMEYGDGQVYMLASPSTQHQRISMVLSNIFFNYFKDSTCEVFAAPYDIVLKKENMDNYWVIPDLSVLCNKDYFTENRYEGIPSLIVEIVSPSNQSDDLVRKLNVYQKYGVQEYWIVNPIKNLVMIYWLDDSGYTIENAVIKSGIVESRLFKDLKVSLDNIFDNKQK